jgi:hypothetical protein
LFDRLMSRIVVCRNGCWEWQQRSNVDRYGRVVIAGRKVLAHRAVYSVLVGEIPDYLVLDHLCEYRLCVNPDHLEPVTQKVNIRRYHKSDVAGRRKKRRG